MMTKIVVQTLAILLLGSLTKGIDPTSRWDCYFCPYCFLCPYCCEDYEEETTTTTTLPPTPQCSAQKDCPDTPPMFNPAALEVNKNQPTCTAARQQCTQNNNDAFCCNASVTVGAKCCRVTTVVGRCSYNYDFCCQDIKNATRTLCCTSLITCANECTLDNPFCSEAFDPPYKMSGMVR